MDEDDDANDFVLSFVQVWTKQTKFLDKKMLSGVSGTGTESKTEHSYVDSGRRISNTNNNVQPSTHI